MARCGREAGKEMCASAMRGNERMRGASWGLRFTIPFHWGGGRTLLSSTRGSKTAITKECVDGEFSFLFFLFFCQTIMGRRFLDDLSVSCIIV